VIKDPNHGGYSIEFGNAEHLAPNHSFRHYLKSELLARDVPERISDAITGHKTPGIGRKYEHVEMSKKFDAISKLPVIPLQAAREQKTWARALPVTAVPQLREREDKLAIEVLRSRPHAGES
jgi:hypothetical protein